MAPRLLLAEDSGGYVGSDGVNVTLNEIKCFNQDSCCDYWGDLGKCADNDYMKFSCPATCKQCDRSVPKSSTLDDMELMCLNEVITAIVKASS